MLRMALAVAAGGASGALVRMFFQGLLNQEQGWPWGTLLANLLGCFIAGILIHRGHSFSAAAHGFLMTGTLGALTTFSSFAVEGVKMLTDRDYLKGGSYIFLTLTGSLLACFVGWYLSSKLDISWQS